MSDEVSIERLVLTPEDWVPWSDLDRLGRVSTLLPAGYGSYLRIFHPILPRDGDAGRPVLRWEELARKANVEFTGEISIRSLDPYLPRTDSGYGVTIEEGLLDEPARSALYGALLATVGDSSTYFYYGMARMTLGLEEQTYRAQLSRYREVDSMAQSDAGPWGLSRGPDYVWPSDRRWVFVQDTDMNSSYLAGPPEPAKAVLQSPDIEAIEVRHDSRLA